MKPLIQQDYNLKYSGNWVWPNLQAQGKDSEKEMRFKLFKQNVEFIESFNSGGNWAYKLRINEFRDTHNGYKRSSNVSRPFTTAMKPFRHGREA